MKLAAKTAVAFAIALLTLAAVATAGMFNIERVAAQERQYVAKNIAAEQAASLVLVTFKTQVQEWKNTLLRGREAAQRERYWKAFQKSEAEVLGAANSLVSRLPDGESRELLQRFVQAHQTMAEGYRRGYAAFVAANADAAVGDKAVQGIDREPAKLLDDVIKKLKQDSEVAHQQAAESASRTFLVTLSAMAVALVIALVSAVAFARSIARPLVEAVDIANQLAQGDLTKDVASARSDEAGELLRALGQSTLSLRQLIKQVRGGVDSVATASAQIAAGNQDLSSRTEEQASNLQQTAASMEQLTSTVKQNADAAKQANQLAGVASDVATKGGETVGQVVNTMQAITESSKKIAEIIGVIDGIAFQTNILALNAAVEAARAGEQGRGFAVVAGEVRSLAQRSAQAAREIKSLISDSVQKVETGSRQVSEAGSTMDEIVTQVRRVTDLIGEITSATSEQSSGISQVGGAVQQLDQVTQQNAALVEESAAAADSLREQAAKLTQAVAVFKLA